MREIQHENQKQAKIIIVYTTCGPGRLENRTRQLIITALSHELWSARAISKQAVRMRECAEERLAHYFRFSCYEAPL